MAMIICPGCGKEISDRATACPHCGYVLEKEKQIKKIICEECGIEFDESLDVCPNCGCPKSKETKEDVPQKVEVTKVAVNKKKLVTGIIIFILLAGAIVGGIFAKKTIDKKNAEKAEKAYCSKLQTTTYDMLTGCASAEEAAGLIHDVWRNAIYEEEDSSTDEYTQPNGYFVSDFNDALANLEAEESFSKKIDGIRENQDMVERKIKELKNPPEKYKEAYEAIKDFYDSYLEFTNLATNPSGSLQTYTSDYNDLDSEVMSKYKKMDMFFE